MRNSNLAYRETEHYQRVDSGSIGNITNKRTSGGIMIKTSSKKTAKVNTAKRTMRRAKADSRSTAVSVIILVGMAFLVLFRGLMLTSGYEQLEAKNALLSDTISENQKLQFKIDQAMDLKNIEEIAKNNYNMSQPTKDQTVYINLDQMEEVTKVRETNSFIDAVKNFFGGIVEYFA